MKIETERQASVTILTPAVRRLDASVAVAFKSAIAQEIGEAPGDLIVDFSEIDFIDSSGLGTLVSLMKMMNGRGEMTLCALNRHPQYVHADPYGSYFPHLRGSHLGTCAVK